MTLALALPFLLAVQGSGEPDTNWDVDLSWSSHGFPDAELDRLGSLEVTRTGLHVGLARDLDARRRVSVGLGYEASVYDFLGQGGVGVPAVVAGIAGAPASIDSFQAYGLGASLVTEIDEQRSWTLQAWTRIGQESGASLGGSATYGVGAHYAFPLTDEIQASAGGFVSTRLDDGVLVYPWFTLDWYPTERLHIGSEGEGQGLGYDWLDDVRAYVSGSFAERSYRLGDTSILRDDEYALNAGVVWNATDAFSVELFGGWAARSITVTPAGAPQSTSDDAEIVPFLGLALRYGF